MKFFRLQRKKLPTFPELLTTGANITEGRWHRHIPIIYCAESIALAAYEITAHVIRTDLIEEAYNILTLEIPDEITAKTLKPEDLPKDWKDNYDKYYDFTQDLGMRWFKSVETCILKVPSVLIPQEFNCIINSRHHEFKKISVTNIEIFTFDKRFRLLH
jgi:RES domain-containing protein